MTRVIADYIEIMELYWHGMVRGRIDWRLHNAIFEIEDEENKCCAYEDVVGQLYYSFLKKEVLDGLV